MPDTDDAAREGGDRHHAGPSPAEPGAAPRAKGSPVDLAGEGVYKRHRIHVAQLHSGVWVASAVHFGAQDSGVEAVRGEYPTRADAITAAQTHIDREAAAGAE